MVKRSLTLALLLALVLTSFGLTAAPAVAAPAHAVAGAPNADVLPADTAFYFDFKIGDLNKTLDYVRATYKTVTDEELPPVFAQINMGLSQALKRDATFEKDVQSWLGDHISLAFRVTDEQYDMLNKAFEGGDASMSTMRDLDPQAVVVIAVKDDAAASKFMTEVIELAMAESSSAKLEQRTVDVNGTQVTVYDQTENCGQSCPSFAMIKGYIVAGITESVDEVLNSSKNNTPRLSADANFSKVMGKLKPDNLLSMYISPRLLSFAFMGLLGVQQSMGATSSSILEMESTGDADEATAEPTPDPVAQIRQLINVMRAYNGQAIGVVHTDTAWTIDIVQRIDMKALETAYTDLGLDAAMLKQLQGTKVEGKLAGQIPNDAIAVVLGSGLGNLYEGIQAGLKANSKLFGEMNPNMQDMDAIPQMLEGGVMMAFGVDLAEELKGWANGEFAIYMRYNAESVLANAGRDRFPFDLTVIVDSSDTAKTKAFLEKINQGFERMESKENITVESAGTDLYTITGKEGVAISYGLVGNTFIITTASGLEAASNATKGDGVLNALPQWKAAQQTAVQPYTQFWFINMNEIGDAIKEAASTMVDEDERPQFEQFMKFLGLFDTLSVSSGPMDAEGITIATVQLIEK